MSNSASSGDGLPDKSSTPSHHVGVGPTVQPEVPSSDLLDRVIRETLATAQEADQLSTDQMRTLMDVVRRHPAAPIHTVATELVNAVLKSQFQVSAESSPFWLAASQRIAETLVEDPLSRQRLTALWEKLMSAVQES